MTIVDAMKSRHAIRKFQTKKIEKEISNLIDEEINKCNKKNKLSIQLITNEPNTFRGVIPFFAGFRNVKNYIALVGPNDDDSAEKLGYYGQHLVLKAQQLGLNTCWVGATFNRKKCKAVVDENETLSCVIALGYGAIKGTAHKSKNMPELCKVDKHMPDWFRSGMEAVMLAPTTNNRQDFKIYLKKDHVHFEINEDKFKQLNLGILKYHFEKGSNRKSFVEPSMFLNQ